MPSTTLYAPWGGSVSVDDTLVSAYKAYGYSETEPEGGSGGGDIDTSELSDLAVVNGDDFPLFDVNPYVDGSGVDVFTQEPSNIFSASTRADATGSHVFVTGVGWVDLHSSSTQSSVTVVVAPGQTAPVLEVRNTSDVVLFRIGADGHPQHKSSDGTFWRVTVSDEGVLTTTEVV